MFFCCIMCYESAGGGAYIIERDNCSYCAVSCVNCSLENGIQIVKLVSFWAGKGFVSVYEHDF